MIYTAQQIEAEETNARFWEQEAAEHASGCTCFDCRKTGSRAAVYASIYRGNVRKMRAGLPESELGTI